eukprot:607637-Pleurochrysis_carterae.AAC.1
MPPSPLRPPRRTSAGTARESLRPQPLPAWPSLALAGAGAVRRLPQTPSWRHRDLAWRKSGDMLQFGETATRAWVNTDTKNSFIILSENAETRIS